jgi:hypothetical protein
VKGSVQGEESEALERDAGDGGGEGRRNEKRFSLQGVNT